MQTRDKKTMNKEDQTFELYKKFAKHLYKKGYIDGINFEKQEQGLEEDEITEEEFDTWGVSDSIDDAVEELFNQIKGEIFYERISNKTKTKNK